MKSTRFPALVILLSAVLALGGCATGASKESMAVAPTVVLKKFTSSVKVEARGGSETGAMDSSNISNADLKSAIEASSASSGLFKTLSQTGGDYELTVNLTQLSKPIFGGAFTVDMETAWSLVKAADKSIVMRKVVRSSHTATFSDSLVGVTRLKLAVEGAARKNIEDGLKAVSELPL
jgi:ABC-type uncharacterized transport system auxiliary subunit